MMCGRLNVCDDQLVISLLESLNVEPAPLITSPFITPCKNISIIVEQNQQRQLKQAIWWLLLAPSASGFSPSKYTSFNTRYDKLNVPGSAGFIPFRQSRCIIPVTGFGETEFVGKKPIHYHNFTASESAMALAGLYKTWLNKQTGELVYSCSVITNPPHKKLRQLHSKASPCLLPLDQTLDAWLNTSSNNTEQFEHLFTPNIPYNLLVQQIDKPSSARSINLPFMIGKD